MTRNEWVLAGITILFLSLLALSRVMGWFGSGGL